MMRFTGQHIIITGASSGIGRATAERIVAEGGRVSLIARTAAKLAEAAEVLGPAALPLPCDVGDKAALLAALDQAVTHHGPVDGLFLNAAAEGMYGPTPDYTDAALEEVLRVNAVSPFWAVRHLLPGMIARGRGAILVTGSLGAETGMEGNVGYLMAKHAVLGLARGVAMEAAPHGVRCNCINPGFIDTPMLAGTPDDFKAAMAARVPQERIGRPEEAAALAAFLLSNDANHVTAQSWAVDGGLLGTLKM
jgi:NAD(P)-dependent dehydrogenase (short-subunit alcohol dehydrogenase family)